MDDVKTSMKDSILRLLDEAGGSSADPQPPASYFMSSLEMMALSVFENNRPLLAWMRERDLDPRRISDAVLGIGLLLTLDARNNPQPELPEEDPFEDPDDHHH